MVNRVILELDGDFYTAGFRATLEIYADHDTHTLAVRGHLPPAPEIAHHLHHHWHDAYRALGLSQRIKGQKIVHKGSLNRRIKYCRASADELRDRFRGWLNAESFQVIDRRLREELNRRDVIRFLIRTDNIYLQKLPWHEWDFFERYPNAEVAFSASDYESTDYESIPLHTQLPSTETVRILAILGHREGINLDSDRHILEQLPHATVEFLVEPDRQQVSDRLWEQSWDILFFAGHSETDGETGRIYINPTDSLTLSDLKYGLRKAIDHGLQLAIFNSCDGLGLIQELQPLHIPHMIVMREPVTDQVAEIFLKYFLEYFAAGESLYLAERHARERLQGLEHQFPCASWLPIIYQHPLVTPPDWFSLRGNTAQATAPADLVYISRPPSPQISTRKRLVMSNLQVLGLSLSVALLVMIVRFVGLLQPLELNAYDHLMRSRPIETIDDRILVVEVTQDDVNQRGGYPLDDATLAQAVDILQPFSPVAIALDMHRHRPRGNGRQALIQQFQRHPNLFTVCAFDQPDQDYAPPPELSPDQLITQVGFSNLVIDANPAQPLTVSSIGQLVPIDGSAVRRHLLSYEPDLAPTRSPCITPYSLSFQLGHRFMQAKGIAPIVVTGRDDWKLGSVVFHPLPHRFSGYQSLEGDSTQIMLNYRTAQPGQKVSLNQVLQGDVNADIVTDRIVLVGYTASVARDAVETPLGSMSGVWVHAHMVSQLLSSVLDGRPLIWALPHWRALQWGDGLWIIIWSLISGLLARRLLRSPILVGLMIAGLVGGLYYICLMALNQGGWLPIIPTAMSVFLTVSVVVIYQMSRRKR